MGEVHVVGSTAEGGARESDPSFFCSAGGGWSRMGSGHLLSYVAIIIALVEEALLFYLLAVKYTGRQESR